MFDIADAFSLGKNHAQQAQTVAGGWRGDKISVYETLDAGQVIQ
jgi:hypothetical protein